MREIRFRGAQAFGTNKGKMLYGNVHFNSDEMAIEDGYVCTILQPDTMAIYVDPETVGQFTGLKDRHGADIYEGDILNICFTSESGEWIHDGVYVARISDLKGLFFEFKSLSWINHGYNQYSLTIELSCANKLSDIWDGNTRSLCIQDQYVAEPEVLQQFPFNHEKILSFHSRYLEIIGDIYTNPELAESIDD